MKLKEFEEIYGRAKISLNKEGIFKVYLTDPKVYGKGYTVCEAIDDLLNIFKEMKKINI